jgi:hypothetical protein
MVTRILYTVEPDRLWRAFAMAAERRGVALQREPPEVAVDLGDARLYITETEPSWDIPPSATALGPGLREFVVDAHDYRAAEAFLADVVRGLPVVIDDDAGNAVSSAEFVLRAHDNDSAM